jgi:hypothetical protein
MKKPRLGIGSGRAKYQVNYNFIGVAYQGKDIVFRFIIEYIVA